MGRLKRETMECPYCKELEYEHTDSFVSKETLHLEYTCSSCHKFGYFDEKLPGDPLREALIDISKGLE